MRQFSAVVAVLVLAITASACGSDRGASAGDRTTMVGDRGLDVCSLVSDKTVASLQGVSDGPQAEPAELLMPGAELFVECRVVSGVDVGFAVRGAPGGPPVESLVEGEYDTAAEPLDGVGDEAFIGSNTYDGVRVAAVVGDQELIVNSNAYDGGDGIGRDEVVALAKEVAANLGAEKPGPFYLPKVCPTTSDPKIEAAVGTALLARGSAAKDGSVICSYVSETRKVRLGAVTGNAGMNLMAQADSEEGDRIEVDGDPAVYDDRDGVAVFVGDTCVLGASASPVGWGLADQRPEGEQRDETIDLVTYVKESIGCPS